MFVTSLYAGLLAIWFLVLSARVIARRRSDGIHLGDGADNEMQRRIRGHANFAEYVPICLVLIAVLEYGGTAGWLLHLLGATLLVGRVLHGYALSFTEHFFQGRFLGTVLTFGVLAVAGLLCAYRGIMAHLI